MEARGTRLAEEEEEGEGEKEGEGEVEVEGEVGGEGEEAEYGCTSATLQNHPFKYVSML